MLLILILTPFFIVVDGIRLPFTEYFPTKFDFPEDFEKRFVKIEKKSMDVGKSFLYQLQSENIKELEKVLKYRNEYFKYANWNSFGRKVALTSSGKERLGEGANTVWVHKYYGNDLYNTRHDLIVGLKKYSKIVQPRFLATEERSVQRALMPLFVGEYAIFLSNFVNDILCPDLVLDREKATSKVMVECENGDFVFAVSYQ